jgi:cytosine/adenosine deaminase-related metal-dependent hydrolase
MATHVSESQEEFDMFLHAAGTMFEWLQPQRDVADCGKGSPIDHVARQGLLGDNLLAIHVNYLAPGDASLLGRNRASAVHCPRSHDYFGHAPFPHAELAKAGVNICLGTDSLATVRLLRAEPTELDLFAEMRAFAKHQPDLSCKTILEHATLHGAKSLGMSGKLGELSEGAFADLITVPSMSDIENVCEAVIHHTSPVSGVMINGRWAIAPDSL